MINAIRLTEELEKVGFTPDQAKKSVDTWMSLMNDNFATKADLRELQLANKAELREFQVNIQEQIKDLSFKMDQLSSKLIISLVGVMVAVGTIMTAILGLIIKS